MGGSTIQPEQYVHDLPRLQDIFMVVEFSQVFMRMYYVMGLQVVVDIAWFST